jgi:hypothetical protein
MSIKHAMGVTVPDAKFPKSLRGEAPSLIWEQSTPVASWWSINKKASMIAAAVESMKNVPRFRNSG